MSGKFIKSAHAHAILALALTAILAVGIGAVAPAAAQEEVGNSTVEVTNSTDSIYAQVAWNDTAGTDNQTADITIENETGDVVATRTMDAVDNSTEIEEFDVGTQGFENGDYTVKIDVANGSSGYVESTEVGKFEQVAAGGGGIDGSTAGMGVLLVVLGGGFAYYMRD
jgi:hypothetical protein